MYKTQHYKIEDVCGGTNGLEIVHKNVVLWETTYNTQYEMVFRDTIMNKFFKLEYGLCGIVDKDGDGMVECFEVKPVEVKTMEYHRVEK